MIILWTLTDLEDAWMKQVQTSMLKLIIYLHLNLKLKLVKLNVLQNQSMKNPRNLSSYKEGQPQQPPESNIDNNVREETQPDDTEVPPMSYCKPTMIVEKT